MDFDRLFEVAAGDPYQARLIRWRKFVEQFAERGIDGFLMRKLAERRKGYRYPKALIVTLSEGRSQWLMVARFAKQSGIAFRRHTHVTIAGTFPNNYRAICAPPKPGFSGPAVTS